MTINRIGPVSCAKIAGAIYAVIGLLVGALVSVFALLVPFVGSTPRPGPESALTPFLAVFFGVGAIVITPILYGVMGFVFALIAAWCYNLVASKIGGIQIDVS